MNNRRKWLMGMGAAMMCILLYFAFLHLKIREHVNIEVSADADYLIILGARVKGDLPSLSLQYRIDAAAEYLKNNNKTIAIASGGKGAGEDISEAEAIKRGLVEQGITESRIILEDQSTSTAENIKFSKELIPKNLETGMLVSNDFHIYRAKSIARDQGLNLGGLPAETPAVAIPKSYAREYLAISKYYLVKLF